MATAARRRTRRVRWLLFGDFALSLFIRFSSCWPDPLWGVSSLAFGASRASGGLFLRLWRAASLLFFLYLYFSLLVVCCVGCGRVGQVLSGMSRLPPSAPPAPSLVNRPGGLRRLRRLRWPLPPSASGGLFLRLRRSFPPPPGVFSPSPGFLITARAEGGRKCIKKVCIKG